MTRCGGPRTHNHGAVLAILKPTPAPGFVIGDEIVPGAIDLETLKGLIAAARRK